MPGRALLMDANIIDKMNDEGWQQQFTASGPRLLEAIDNYRHLGFEVKTIPVKELGHEGCAVCFDDESDDTVMIFIRRTNNSIGNNLYDNIDC